MNELLASLLGAGLVVGLAVPLATLAAKAILVARWRRDPDPRRHGSLATFLVLIAPSLGAVAWFASAALHLSEPGAAAAICTLDHGGAATCVDAALLALLLCTMLVAAITRGWWKTIREPRRGHPGAISCALHNGRLARVCQRHPRLRALRRRITVRSGDVHPICTRGLLRPQIELSADFMDRVSDEALAAALLHEAEHHDARDPLRYLLARASLAINPCGFLLRRELQRWRAAREAVCDALAVRQSADPLALADALVAVARMNAPRPGAFAACLGGPGRGLLRLRVHLLLDYVSAPPRRPSLAPRWLGLGAAVALLALPHVVGAWPLDLAHGALERALAAVGLL